MRNPKKELNWIRWLRFGWEITVPVVLVMLLLTAFIPLFAIHFWLS